MDTATEAIKIATEIVLNGVWVWLGWEMVKAIRFMVSSDDMAIHKILDCMQRIEKLIYQFVFRLIAVEETAQRCLALLDDKPESSENNCQTY